MTEKNLREELSKCSKNELIDMMVIQWRGLGEIQEQLKP